MPSSIVDTVMVIDLREEDLPTYESVTGDRSPFYATGNAGLSPRPVADERLHMPKLPLHGRISTLLIRRPWGVTVGPTQILHMDNDISTRNSSTDVLSEDETDAHASNCTSIRRRCPTMTSPPGLDTRPTVFTSPTSTSTSSTSSRSSSVSTPISYMCTLDSNVSSDCTLSTPEDPCIAQVTYPKTRLASTVRIALGGPLPFEMKMKKVDFGTRSHEFTSPDGRTYVWRYDMLVGSSMSLYCTSGGLSYKGIKVATMERAVSMIESLVRSDRKLRVDTDWINEEVALVTALVMLKKEKDRKNGANN